MKTPWEKFQFAALMVFAIAWTAALGDLVYHMHHLPPETACVIGQIRR